MLTILANFNDKQTTSTLSVSDVDIILYISTHSVKRNYEQSSFNQVTLNADSNQDGQSDIYHISLNYPAGTACNYQQWGTDAKAAAANLGINLEQYQRVMYVLCVRHVMNYLLKLNGRFYGKQLKEKRCHQKLQHQNGHIKLLQNSVVGVTLKELEKHLGLLSGMVGLD